MNESSPTTAHAEVPGSRPAADPVDHRPATSTECPRCGARGKPVKPVTIAALLTAAALARIRRTDGWRFCPTPACEDAYHHPESGQRVAKAEVKVRIGVKEAAAPHPLCYCFGYSVEDIESEVARTGASAVAAAITERCKQGLDRCVETNPQGSCCLGNVRAAEKAALAGGASCSAGEGAAACSAAEPVPPPPEAGDCCAREAAPTPPRGAASRAGLLSSAGAVVSAILASACCWLPLLLVAFGASAAGVSGFFEQYRLAFLGGAGLLLSLGFYFACLRKEACGPDGVCASPSRRRQRLNRVVLWIATGLVVAAGALPQYVGAILSGGEPTATPARGAHASHAVGGMTCEACAVTIRSELEKLPGVARADVSFERKTATVAAAEGSPLPSDDAVIAAVRRAGYVAERAPEAGPAQ